MKPPCEPKSWDRAASARREILAAMPPADDTPPPGFATRIVARWEEIRQNETVRLWSRWSLRAALGGLLTAAVMALFSSPQSTSSPLKAPEIQVPAFSSSR